MLEWITQWASEWFTWSNAFYAIGLIIAGLLTLVSAKYRALVREVGEAVKALQEGYEDGKLSKAEKEKIMKEALDVLRALINLKWKIL